MWQKKFKVILSDENCYIFIKIEPEGFTQQQPSIVLNNGFVPT